MDSTSLMCPFLQLHFVVLLVSYFFVSSPGVAALLDFVSKWRCQDQASLQSRNELWLPRVYPGKKCYKHMMTVSQFVVYMFFFLKYEM